MPENLADFKAIPLKTFLEAAHDGGDFALMAQAILAHPVSHVLHRVSVDRLFRIGYADGLPAPSEMEKMRKACALLIELEGGDHGAA